jgi:HAD superfamily hydrolase (TIGR01509 family)
VTVRALDRAYQESGRFLQGVWAECRDVPVEEHVRAVLRALDHALPGRLSGPVLDALVEAYAQPAILAPPAVAPGAVAALTTLGQRGYALAVVSNTMRTPGRVLRRVLEHHGLLRCFGHTAFSDEIGVRKPSPEIFAIALRAVGGQPRMAVHVGDDPVLDVGGARAAGMRAVHVVPGLAPGPAPPSAADETIGGLAALPAAIARLERGESSARPGGG